MSIGTHDTTIEEGRGGVGLALQSVLGRVHGEHHVQIVHDLYVSQCMHGYINVIWMCLDVGFCHLLFEKKSSHLHGEPLVQLVIARKHVAVTLGTLQYHISTERANSRWHRDKNKIN